MDKNLIWIFVLIFIITSCFPNQKKKLDFDVSDITIPDVKIKRYGKDLFKINPDHFYKELKEIHPNYIVFLGEELPDENKLIPLYNFISDTLLQNLNEDVQNKYLNISFLEDELKRAFQYYLHYFPNATIPEVYTYISGLHFEQAIQISEEAMIIGLDLYLGYDYKTYFKYGIPTYKTARMTSNHITIDCVKELYKQLYQINNNTPKNFLDEIIYNAKQLYFLDALLPQKDDYLKIGFTKEQIRWCNENEHNIWAFFIDKNILYSTNYEIIRKFTKDGPFTLAISKDAPANIGNWVGWQIIRAYKNNNLKITLQELLKETDSQKILKLSSYKPPK
jgi:hypothetical protein